MIKRRVVQLPTWIALALAVIGWKLALVGVTTIAQHHWSYRPNYAYTQLTEDEKSAQVGGQSTLWSPWANFDGVHYLHIAQHGYQDEGRFFPLYPSLVAGLATVLGVLHPAKEFSLLAGNLVSLICLCGSLLIFKKLLDEDGLPVNKTILALLAFPTAFFLGSVYSESLFLLLSLSSLYAARKGWWGGAGLLAWLLMATRLVGVMIVPALVIEWWWQRRQKKKLTPKIWQLTPVMLSVSSLVAYAWFNQLQWQSWFYFIVAHTELATSRSASLVNPFRMLWWYLKLLAVASPKLFEWWIALLELITLGWVGLVGWHGWRQLRPSYLAFTGLGLAIPLVSGTLSGFPRYALVLWPLHMLVAQRLSGWWWKGYVGISAVMLVTLTALFSLGYYVS